MVGSVEIGKVDERRVFARWWHNVCAEGVEIAGDEKAARVIALDKLTPWRRVTNCVDVSDDNEAFLSASERDTRASRIAEKAHGVLGVGADEGEDDKRPLVSLQRVDVVDLEWISAAAFTCKLLDVPCLGVVHAENDDLVNVGAADNQSHGGRERRFGFAMIDVAVACESPRRFPPLRRRNRARGV